MNQMENQYEKNQITVVQKHFMKEIGSKVGEHIKKKITPSQNSPQESSMLGMNIKSQKKD